MTATETLSALRNAIKANPNDLVSRAALADLYTEMGQDRMAERQRQEIAKRERQAEARKAEREERVDELRKYCPHGSTVYSIVRNVSRSGMQRRITFYAIVNNQPVFLDGMMSNLLGIKRSTHDEGLIINGCGMDMCFATVYNLSRAIHGDGNALYSRCL